MKIFVITGSPRKCGNSNTIVNEFIRGAEENGHIVTRFDASLQNVHPCIACEKCKTTKGECVFKDDFELFKDQLVLSDLVVFATPMYYYGVSSQLKTVIDRFYSINSMLIGKSKKAILILTCADHSQRSTEPVIGYYNALLSYLGWKNVGQIIGNALWEPNDVKDTDLLQKAYEMGKQLND